MGAVDKRLPFHFSGSNSQQPPRWTVTAIGRIIPVHCCRHPYLFIKISGLSSITLPFSNMCQIEEDEYPMIHCRFCEVARLVVNRIPLLEITESLRMFHVWLSLWLCDIVKSEINIGILFF